MEYCSGGELFDHIVEKNKLSEAESRMFFRQIVSAVAYIHSLGYAHRDLKPENILLDKDQNLKLIDFGLCAKPQGGMHKLLSTSCGSPTYAAPELVLGKQYLGPEVDVWAMGVLLYALMAGYLPFDDNNIDSLYKKILSGKYEEPSFMSNESKNLIRQMLQIDPHKRITVTELLSDPWVTLNVLAPVDFFPENIKSFNKECVLVLARYHGLSSEEIWKHLKKWRYDYDTATYFLLLTRKKRGLPLKLSSAAAKVPLRTNSADSVTSRKYGNSCADLSKNEHSSVSASEKKDDDTNTQTLSLPYVNNVKIEKLEKMDNGVANMLISQTVSQKNDGTPRKAQKRIRSPNLDHEYSPVPTKRASRLSTPKTPKCFRLRGKLEPNSSSRLGECSFELEICYLPNMTSSLSEKTPTKSILKNSAFKYSSPATNKQCEFQRDSHVAKVGIRRKRLRGDSWCYKKVCEEVLALTSSDIKQPIESSV
ncbi:protein kinase [Oryctes borbonicus]|uniref:non-specific serine/threonine protein kinase n=1 Tax=Oryctes borbonicus TaxID=1629725 RepID=A0A0T6B951_9SCAR|nr:protein kinase [Oryctes borbonicus]